MVAPLVVAGANVAAAGLANSKVLAMTKNASSRVWEYVKANKPDIATNVVSYFDKTRTTPEALVSGSNQTQLALASKLLQSGVSVGEFIREGALTQKEYSLYAQLFTKYASDNAAIVDKAQVAHATTGDTVLDRLAINVEIADMCSILGVSSDQYSFILTCVNSHRSSDVEQFQLHRRMQRLPLI